MDNRTSKHIECQEYLDKLGKTLGFVSIFPDRGVISYELERKLRGKRPDLLWFFQNPPISRKGGEYFKLNEPYALFEVESAKSWRDIVDVHLKNISLMDFSPHIVFAVICEGKITREEEHELREVANDFGFRLEVIYYDKLREICHSEIDRGMVRNLQRVISFFEMCNIVKDLTKSKVFAQFLNKSRIILEETDTPDVEAEAASFKKLDFGEYIKILDQYELALNDKGTNLIQSLRKISDKGIPKRAHFFLRIEQISKRPVWREIKEYGVRKCIVEDVDMLMGLLEKSFQGVVVSLNAAQRGYYGISFDVIRIAMEVLKRFEIWSDILSIFSAFSSSVHSKENCTV